MREPDYIGIAGRAWRIDLAKLNALHNVTPEQDNLPGVWIINAPMSHPIWPWYRLILLNLKPVPDMSPPRIYLHGATHEIILHALDPDYYEPEVDGEVPHRVLTPANFGAQMICKDDEDAIKRIEALAIVPIVRGTLDPDTDHLSAWVARFGDNMLIDKPTYN